MAARSVRAAPAHVAAAAAVDLILAADAASAQTYGLATLPTGTLSCIIASGNLTPWPIE
jgi:hypothetical protein